MTVRSRGSGVTVSSRVGNAVVRNRVKRIVREIFRAAARGPAGGARHRRHRQARRGADHPCPSGLRTRTRARAHVPVVSVRRPAAAVLHRPGPRLPAPAAPALRAELPVRADLLRVCPARRWRATARSAGTMPGAPACRAMPSLAPRRLGPCPDGRELVMDQRRFLIALVLSFLLLYAYEQLVVRPYRTAPHPAPQGAPDQGTAPAGARRGGAAGGALDARLERREDLPSRPEIIRRSPSRRIAFAPRSRRWARGSRRSS